MEKKIHFISGLPRSGSTLLSALLRQNPRFTAGVASPLATLFDAVLPPMSGGEFGVFFDEESRLAMLRGLFDSYYGKEARPVLFDSNRSWTGRTALLARLFPDARIVCCVREIGWIVNSVERMLAANPAQGSRLFNFQGGLSAYARAEALMHIDNGLIGLAWATLREAWFGPEARRLILVPYDHLAKEPHRTLRRLYQALDEEYFQHDTANVEFSTERYDDYLGMPGLHTVRSKVEHRELHPTIPPDIFFKYAQTQFWEKPEMNTGGALII
jgi:sulfotransferase